MKTIIKEQGIGETYEIVKNLTFDDFCKGDTKLSNDIFNRWKKLGLLLGLDDETAKKVAYCYEKMAVYLIYEHDLEERDEQFETYVFPLIRRTITNVDNFNGGFNPKEIEDFYYKNIEDCKKEAEGCEYGDEEAETLAILSDKLIEKLKQDGE